MGGAKTTKVGVISIIIGCHATARNRKREKPAEFTCIIQVRDIEKREPKVKTHSFDHVL